MPKKNAKLFLFSLSFSLVAGTALLVVLFNSLPTQAATVTVDATVDAVCGNNIQEGSEVCDGAAGSGNCYNNTCNSDCTCSVCGDGTIEAGEACESNANCSAGFFCNNSCNCQPSGGPGPICTTTCGAWSACINGTQTQNCVNNCTGSFTAVRSCAPVCGNSVVEGGEECDDGNVANRDGCSSSCQLETGCGNGRTDRNEECDDDNTTSGDCCSSSCTIELLIKDVSVTSITNNAATVNWVLRTWRGGACRTVTARSVLEWGRDLLLSDGSASFLGSVMNHRINGLNQNTTYFFEITATQKKPIAGVPDLVTTYNGSFLTLGGVENCTNSRDDDTDGLCDYPASSCTDGAVAGDPDCSCTPNFNCTTGACQPNGQQLVTCVDQTTPTCQPSYQYTEQCEVCAGVVCGACQVLDPNTCSCSDVVSCCGNGSCEPPGEDPFSCVLDCPVECLSDWQCGDWLPAECPPSGIQTRDCFDQNACSQPINPPENQRSCVVGCPGLTCGVGEQINIAQCTCQQIVPFCGNLVCEASEDHSSCPSDCIEICQPSWTCSAWSACDGSTQTRQCDDLNNCNLDLSRPPEVKVCGGAGSCSVACGVCQAINTDSCSCSSLAGCCGNRICEASETNWSCPVDCAVPPNLQITLPACLDGLDNDNDGFTDYPQDPGCQGPADQSELDLRELVRNIAEMLSWGAAQIFDNPVIETFNERYATPLLITAVAVNTFSTFSLLNFFAYLRYLFTEPLAYFFRRRRQKWGVVYNAITKKPVDLAIVRLYRQSDNRLIRSQVTDKLGRFSFLVPPDRYVVTVTKPRYVFPTVLLKNEREDVKYLDLYHGEPIVVKSDGAPITVNVPLDPIEDLRPVTTIIIQHYLRKVQYAAAFSAVPLAALSLAISPSAFTLSLFGFHCLLYVLFRRLGYQRRPKSWGIVYDQSNRQPINLAIARIYDKTYNRLLESRITDSRGRYAFLVDNNKYYLTVEKQGYKQQKTSDIDLVSKQREAIVNLDIGLEKGVSVPAVPRPASIAPPPTERPTMPHDHAEQVSRDSLEALMNTKAARTVDQPITPAPTAKLPDTPQPDTKPKEGKPPTPVDESKPKEPGGSESIFG